MTNRLLWSKTSRHSALGFLGAVTIVSHSITANAQTVQGWNFFHITTPAVECDQATPGSLSYWSGELANWNSSSTLYVSCPVINTDSSGNNGTFVGSPWLTAYSSGTTNGVTCKLLGENASRNEGVSLSPNSRTYGTNYEMENFTSYQFTAFSPAPMWSLECSIEPGAIFEGIDYDLTLQDWSY